MERLRSRETPKHAEDSQYLREIAAAAQPAADRTAPWSFAAVGQSAWLSVAMRATLPLDRYIGNVLRYDAA